MPSEAQREKLHQKALVLFYKKGFKATTMRDIASAMNFEAASLYNYFSSKDALLEDLLFSVADQFLHGIRQILKAQTTNIEKIQAVIHLYVSITAMNPYKASLLTSEWRNLKPAALEKFVAHRLTYESHLKKLLQQYYTQSNSKDIDIEVALHTLLGSLRWICDWYIRHEGEIDPGQLQAQLTNLIIDGMKRPS